MSKLALTDRIDAARLRALLSYDPATGIFHWRVHWGNRSAGAIAGYRKVCGHWSIQVDSRSYFVHRLAWLWMTGRWPTQIDHRNRDPADNCWRNLREASPATNSRNQKLRTTNTSGRVGVNRRPSGNYRASICVNYRKLYLGTFRSFDAAVAARLAAQQRYGFAPGHGTPRRRPIHRRPIHVPRQVQLDLYGQVGAP